MARKKGVTISEAAEATGKSKGSIYQEVTLIRKAGYKVYKKYEKASRSHRYTLG
jgi:DNA-binding transcriptional regulator GbsR (MarR family)